MLSDTVRDLFSDFAGNRESLTHALRGVTDEFREICAANPGSPEIDFFAAEVGNAARDESNRLPLGESGLLIFFCSMLSSKGLRSTLVVQCLRIIANSCADEDENRKRVIDSGCIPTIVSMLKDDSLCNYATSVLFNLCVDFDPAQKAIYQARINPELVSLISSPGKTVDTPMGLVCKLLGFVATQEPETDLVDPSTPFVLLSLANDQPEPLVAEDFLAKVSAALMYLSRDGDQRTFLEKPGAIEMAINVYRKTCTCLDTRQMDAEDQAQHKQIQTTFISTLADLSAQPSFNLLCPIDEPLARTLQTWIRGPSSQLQSAACLMLGNIARSDEVCKRLVHHSAIHDHLVAILRDKENADAIHLHCVLSFLKNLAIPQENKLIVGNSGLLDADMLPRIWDIDTQPQVQFAAVSLCRLLLLGCSPNVRRVCAPLQVDEPKSELENRPSSPTSSVTLGARRNSGRTALHGLLDLNARSDYEPVQMESARAVAAVCRSLHTYRDAHRLGQDPDLASRFLPTYYSLEFSSSSHDSPDAALAAFYQHHPTIADVMASLAIQTKFPALRAEVFLIFSIMARTRSGFGVIARAVHKREFAAAIEAVAGGKGKEEHTNTAVDNGAENQVSTSSTSTALPLKEVRSNALAFIATILRECPDENTDEEGQGNVLPSDVRQTFEKLLQESGREILREQGGRQSGKGKDTEGIDEESIWVKADEDPHKQRSRCNQGAS